MFFCVCFWIESAKAMGKISVEKRMILKSLTLCLSSKVQQYRHQHRLDQAHALAMASIEAKLKPKTKPCIYAAIEEISQVAMQACVPCRISWYMHVHSYKTHIAALLHAGKHLLLSGCRWNRHFSPIESLSSFDQIT